MVNFTTGSASYSLQLFAVSGMSSTRRRYQISQNRFLIVKGSLVYLEQFHIFRSAISTTCYSVNAESSLILHRLLQVFSILVRKSTVYNLIPKEEGSLAPFYLDNSTVISGGPVIWHHIFQRVNFCYLSQESGFLVHKIRFFTLFQCSQIILACGFHHLFVFLLRKVGRLGLLIVRHYQLFSRHLTDLIK